MIGRIAAIALNTFREATRNKILYLLLFFAVALILSALWLGQLSLHEEARLTRDLGLGGIALFSTLIAIFVGVNLVYKELDRKTVFALVPKPIYRHELLVGKYLGIALTLIVQIALMAAVLFGVIAIQSMVAVRGVGLDDTGPLLRAVVLLVAHALVVAAIAVLFSSFSTPILSGAFTLGLVIVGRSLPELRGAIAKLEDGALRTLFAGATHVLPDLHLFSISGSMLEGRRVSVHGTFIDWSYVATSSAYGLVYAAAALAVAALLFHRRDFV